MDFRRIREVLENVGEASIRVTKDDQENGRIPLRRFEVIVDIIWCSIKYRMLCSEYMSENMYDLRKEEKHIIGEEYRIEGIKKDAWQKDFQKNRRFFARWSKPKFEVGVKRLFRQRAYAKRYNAGIGLIVEDNVYISRHHFLPGNISIGKHVYIARNSCIDFSGGVIVNDGVRITNGVIIETHAHLYHSDWRKDFNDIVAKELVIEEGAILGVKSVILPSCHYIGKYSRVGAGAIVTKDVPDYTIVAGVPAKVIKEMDHEE